MMYGETFTAATRHNTSCSNSRGGIIYPCSEDKGADQLRSYCEADLRLCFRTGKNPGFSFNHAAHVTLCYKEMFLQYLIFEHIMYTFNTLRKLAHAIYRDFLALKIENFQRKNFDIFLIFAQNIDCVYTLEPPQRGGSNEYPHSMFWSKNKKK